MNEPKLDPITYIMARIEALEVLAVEMWAERLSAVPQQDADAVMEFMRNRADNWGSPSWVVAEDAEMKQAAAVRRALCMRELLAGIKVNADAYRTDIALLAARLGARKGDGG